MGGWVGGHQWGQSWRYRPPAARRRPWGPHGSKKSPTTDFWTGLFHANPKVAEDLGLKKPFPARAFPCNPKGRRGLEAPGAQGSISDQVFSMQTQRSPRTWGPKGTLGSPRDPLGSFGPKSWATVGSAWKNPGQKWPLGPQVLGDLWVCMEKPWPEMAPWAFGRMEKPWREMGPWGPKSSATLAFAWINPGQKWPLGPWGHKSSATFGLA